jgi:nucleoid DNA-binding protein
MKTLTLDDAYIYYKELHGSKEKFNISRKEFRKICYAFNKELVNKVLEGLVVKLPYNLGEFYVKKFQVRWGDLRINWKLTKEQGKKVFLTGENSDNYACKWVWQRSSKESTNVSSYSFKTTKANRKGMAKVMNEPNGHKRFLV